MPYIFSEVGEERWIDGANPRPYEKKMEMVAVDRRVNNPAATDDPSLIRPAARTHSWW
jgi:hypothetical protein